MPEFLRSAPYLLWLAASVPTCVAFAFAAEFGLDPRPIQAPLYFVLVYPLLEELVFRGLLQQRLQRIPLFAGALQGVSWAVLVAAFVFALAHLVRAPWPWAAAVFLPGVIFGWSYARYRTLAAPILLHVAYNGAVWLGGLLRS